MASALALALAALALGTAIYLLARPAGSTWLRPDAASVDLRSTEAAQEAGGPLDTAPWRLLGGILPALLHTLAFSLLGALALGFSRRGLLISAAFWVVVGMGFEALQHPQVASALLPTSLLAEADAPWLLGLLGRYAHLGTFDPLDLAAVLAGGALACLLGLRWLRSA